MAFSQKKTKSHLLITFCITIIFIFFTPTKIHLISLQESTFSQDSVFSNEKKTAIIPEQWITIFIHGTSLPALSLLSFSKVLEDNIENSLYLKLQKKMRKINWFTNPGFGIIPLDPKQLEKQEPKEFSYYIVKAYRSIELSLTKEKSNNDFYYYGWSGVLSKTERLKESIRLYYELNNLIKRYKSFGINPKIRLIGYSHGGNIGLYLGAIHSIINTTNDIQFYEKKIIKPVQDALSTKNIYHLVTPLHELNTHPISIDEFILYATPIHQETESFCTASLFKKVINIYSENDLIQLSDIISTEYRTCKRIISEHFIKNNRLNAPEISQIKIMINRTFKESNRKEYNETNKTDRYKNFFSKSQEMLAQLNIKAPMQGGLPITEFHEDLTHKDFWLVKYNRQPKLFFSPLPFVIFTPLVVKILEKVKSIEKNTYHFDINVYNQNNAVSFGLYAHNNPAKLITTELCQTRSINAINSDILLCKKL